MKGLREGAVYVLAGYGIGALGWAVVCLVVSR